MIYADGRPLVCPDCGHAVESDGQPGVDRLWYLVCVNDDTHVWQLDTVLHNQPPNTTAAPVPARSGDPDTSHTAAALPREGRRRETYDLLTELGAATSHDIAAAVNQRTPDKATTPNNVARRLLELEEAGLAVRAGTRQGRTLYQPARQENVA